MAHQGLSDRETLDPTVLWKTLMSYYDTAKNRANVSLYDTRCFWTFLRYTLKRQLLRVHDRYDT